MKKIINKDQQGFTIIELVIVLVLIGIVSAVALPKFSNLTAQARIGNAKSHAGNLGASVALAHSQWISMAQPAHIKVNDQDVFMSTTIGWPQNVGTTATTLDASKCVDLWNALLQSNLNSASTTSGCTASGDCQFETSVSNVTSCVYTDKDQNTITYNTTNGDVAFAASAN